IYIIFMEYATTYIYILSLHDTLPISTWIYGQDDKVVVAEAIENREIKTYLQMVAAELNTKTQDGESASPKYTKEEIDHILMMVRSEEHTSELQSREDLVCRLLLEKKK